MKPKRWVLIIVVIAILFVVLTSVQSIRLKHEAQKRQLQYEETLKKYSDTLKPGSSRTEVESYLNERNIKFSQRPSRFVIAGFDDLVLIGEEKAPSQCRSKLVYLDFEFGVMEPTGSTDALFLSPDKLAKIEITPQFEGCL
jgi:hypothetical protein